MTKTPDPKEVERLAQEVESPTGLHDPEEMMAQKLRAAAALRALVLRNQELEAGLRSLLSMGLHDIDIHIDNLLAGREP